ncbi:Glu-tRNA(Gln) amidotransferase subunit GatD [Candidatus Bathyarchaeota archaeon]|nr:MAG: Glu-tRNA(Gln) amidotransferase subunit GatD [Candidatus Bathyarchaeota archaeon]
MHFLKEVEAEVGDTIRVSKGKGTYEGVLIPRSEFSDGNHVVIKLKNGYNIGILVTQETKIERVGAGQKPTFSTSPLPKQQEELPEVTILSTGGTIASRVDYRTGGVRPALNANDLYSIVPELSEIATIKAEILYTVFSENITPKHWIKLAKEIAKNIKEGVAGIVVAHGTDTIGYTAAALSFALQNIPVPIVLVGSQRSADRPSSDAATNLIGAVTVASKAPFAEVVVAMHRTTSDKAIALHRGTKVRKCHTSRRDAFKSINTLPLAILEDGELRMLTQDYQRRNPKREVIVKPSFNEKVALVKFHPGLNRGVIDWYLDQGYEGIVLEGTGLGHVSSQCFATLRRAIAENCLVAMTSQCIWGRVNMNVYDTGRDLIKIGVIPLGDMLSETALVKIMWVLAQTKSVDEAKKLLAKNVTHEVSDRTVYQDYER